MTGPGSSGRSSSEVLADPNWVGRQIRKLGAAWASADARVNATLWWYMVSSAYLREPLRRWVCELPSVDPALSATTITLHPDGTVNDVVFTASLPSEDFPAALGGVLGDVIGAVVDAPEPSLWAIASDALANRALDADRDRGSTRAEMLAARLPEILPMPRFVDVDGHVFVRRSSCCLLYETGRSGKCTSCPRRAPEERAGLLTELVRRGR